MLLFDNENTSELVHLSGVRDRQELEGKNLLNFFKCASWHLPVYNYARMSSTVPVVGHLLAKMAEIIMGASDSRNGIFDLAKAFTGYLIT